MSLLVPRTFIRILTFLYGAVGFILFFFPGWSSQNFAWKISPWVAMTIGAWCLGNAFISWSITRLKRWSSVYATLVYLWSFGILESLVLLAFRDRLILTTPLAWIYMGTLAVNVLVSILGIYAWIRQRPHIDIDGGPISGWIHRAIIGGIVIVGLITLSVPANMDRFISGETLPEKLSVFTMSAFASFYLSLVLGGLTFIPKRGLTPIQLFTKGGIALSILITIPALIFFKPEHYVAYQGVVIYTVAYILILIPASMIVRYRNRS